MNQLKPSISNTVTQLGYDTLFYLQFQIDVLVQSKIQCTKSFFRKPWMDGDAKYFSPFFSAELLTKCSRYFHYCVNSKTVFITIAMKLSWIKAKYKCFPQNNLGMDQLLARKYNIEWWSKLFLVRTKVISKFDQTNHKTVVFQDHKFRGASLFTRHFSDRCFGHHLTFIFSVG